MRHAVTLRRERLKAHSSKFGEAEFSRASEKQALVQIWRSSHYKNDKDTTNIVNSQMDVVFSNNNLKSVTNVIEVLTSVVRF
jgi:hypothetical protein